MGNLFRLYIDESGDHNYRDYSNPKYDIPSERYLGLMGVAIKKQFSQQIHADLETLKQTHFDYDTDDPIIFHRKDILYKRGPFHVLKNPSREASFNNDLISFLTSLKCVLIIVVIDKKHLFDTHGNSAYNPYHFAMTAMMERYCGFLNFLNKKGDIIAEARGKKEDNSLEKEYSQVYNDGTYFYKGPNFFQRALTTKKLKIRTKNKNIAGLQIADILANPCKKEILIEKGRMSQTPSTFSMQLCNCIREKYNMQVYTQKVEGYGKVFIG